MKGTRDLLPPDTSLWQRVEAEAHRVFAAYHYGEIRTPILEETALFARSVGTDTDIVMKEMYTFQRPAYRKALEESSGKLAIEVGNGGDSTPRFLLVRR